MVFYFVVNGWLLRGGSRHKGPFFAALSVRTHAQYCARRSERMHYTRELWYKDRQKVSHWKLLKTINKFYLMCKKCFFVSPKSWRYPFNLTIHSYSIYVWSRFLEKSVVTHTLLNWMPGFAWQSEVISLLNHAMNTLGCHRKALFPLGSEIVWF